MCESVVKINWGDGRSHSDKGVWPPRLLESSTTWITLKCYKFNREDMWKWNTAEGLSSPEGEVLMATYRWLQFPKDTVAGNSEDEDLGVGEWAEKLSCKSLPFGRHIPPNQTWWYLDSSMEQKSYFQNTKFKNKRIKDVYLGFLVYIHRSYTSAAWNVYHLKQISMVDRQEALPLCFICLLGRWL